MAEPQSNGNPHPAQGGERAKSGTTERDHGGGTSHRPDLNEPPAGGQHDEPERSAGADEDEAADDAARGRAR